MAKELNLKLDPGQYTGTYEADGGHLALDFTNTISNRLGDSTAEEEHDNAPNGVSGGVRREVHDWLSSYTNLVAWGVLVDILSPAEAKQLLQEAEGRSEEAGSVLAAAIEVRETIYRIFLAIAKDQAPHPADMELLNAYLSTAMSYVQLAEDDGVFNWGWGSNGEALDRITWPVIRAAADLLTSDQLGRVGECPGEGCGWLFLDTSKNRSRRWCSMAECGNRAKARRHYARVKDSGAD